MENIINSLQAGDITFITSAILLISAFIFGAIGGAIGGIIVGGKHMGYELAAMMGGFYGPIAAVPGTIVALLVLLFI